MLQLDYALLCDYVRGEGGVAHVIAAGMDTIYRPEVCVTLADRNYVVTVAWK